MVASPIEERRGLRTDLLIAFLYVLVSICSLILNRVGMQAETTLAVTGFLSWMSFTLQGSLVVLGLVALGAAVFQLYETWVPGMNGLGRLVTNVLIASVVAALLFVYLGSVTVSGIAGGIVAMAGLWYSDEKRLQGRQKSANYNHNHAALTFDDALLVWFWSGVVSAVVFGIYWGASWKVELNVQWQFLTYAIFRMLFFSGLMLIWHLILGGWAATMRNNSPWARFGVAVVTGLIAVIIAPLLGLSSMYAVLSGFVIALTMMAATDWPGSRKVVSEATE